MATAGGESVGPVQLLAGLCYEAVSALGDFALFSLRVIQWLFYKPPSGSTLTNSLYYVGVRSVPVVSITGLFIGMVLAVQAYSQFNQLGMETRLGSIINVSIIRELGPVLAATMLAGRVGSAMAAELGTMRLSEQIDALSCLGVDPIHYLVVPRFLACFLLIPLLTILANSMGVLGGLFICTRIYHIDVHHYLAHSQGYVGLWDISTGLIKPMFFGAAIALISCHRGFHSEGGSEGVGRAATQAFVRSFIAILIIDFLLAMFLNMVHDRLWPRSGAKFF
ncbi:MAG TPA: ABC transporter permease [Gemmataceae bacterium]|nr:ABC transporter permease [Gemmataceae bacterium]